MVDNQKLRWLALTGPISIVLVLIGWMAMAGFLPPPSPILSGSEIYTLWSEDINLKRLGMVLCIWGGCLYVPFSIALMFALNRIEQDRVWSITQAALGTFGTVFFSLPFLILAMVPFRLEPSGLSIQALHDLGFAMTFSPVAPFSFQYIAIGLSILQDKSERPLIPRWIAFLNFWVAALFVPASLIPFFHEGPFAWNGLLSFWIPVGAFVAWFAVMWMAILRLIAGSQQIPRGQGR